MDLLNMRRSEMTGSNNLGKHQDLGVKKPRKGLKDMPQITDNPAEWTYLPNKGDCGEAIWQHRQNPAAISVDGGKSYWLVDGEDSTLHLSEPAV